MALSSTQFYQGKMKAADPLAELRLPVARAALDAQPEALQAILDPDHPLVWVDTRGSERHRQNKVEAAALVTVLAAILDGLLTAREAPRPFDPAKAAEEIGIITPFRAQMQLIRRIIAERLPRYKDQLEVDTVERFQGREKEIMLMSLVTAGRASTFIANPRRLNVSLTRARTKLILFADLATQRETSALLRALGEQTQTKVVSAPEGL